MIGIKIDPEEATAIVSKVLKVLEIERNKEMGNGIDKDPQVGLNEALLEAQRSSRGLKKDGNNSFGKFNYVSIEEVVSTAREILHKHDLVFFPLSQEMQHAEEDIWVSQKYQLLHVPSGETKDIVRTMVIPDAKSMSPCQAQGSAESYLLKNTLRELLLLPRFDSKEDIDSHDNSKGGSGYRGRTAGNPSRRRA